MLAGVGDHQLFRGLALKPHEAEVDNLAVNEINLAEFGLQLDHKLVTKTVPNCKRAFNRLELKAGELNLDMAGHATGQFALLPKLAIETAGLRGRQSQPY